MAQFFSRHMKKYQKLPAFNFYIGQIDN